MSVAKIKAKETKGKQKVLPKLKAILANPNKTKCPILDEQEMQHLKCLLDNAIKESNLEPKSFTTHKGICLGLESSLRKINNGTSSCVFISLSIKPNHIISLIARNAEIKDKTQPVYAQPKLENFIKELFGIQALCMVFPKNLLAISSPLQQWVEARKKPAKIKKVTPVIKKVKQLKTEASAQTFEKKLKKETNFKNMVKAFSDDFISFGKENQVQKDNLKPDGNEAIGALLKIMDKIPTTKLETKEETQTMDVDKDNEISLGTTALDDGNTSENSNDFLGDYKSLTVHKIKGNPNKNPKKKLKKNKKKKPTQ